MAIAVLAACADEVTVPLPMAQLPLFNRIHYTNQSGRVQVWQLPARGPGQVNSTVKQINSYVLVTTNGYVIVIDGGLDTDDKDYLRAFLSSRGDHVHAWFVSHPHEDHVGALSRVLWFHETPVIDTVYTSILPDSIYDLYASPGNEVSCLQDGGYPMCETTARDVFLGGLAESQYKYGYPAMREVVAGEAIEIDNISIEILQAKDPAPGEEDVDGLINNSSIVMRVYDGFKHVLFTGDLEWRGSERILSTFADSLGKLSAEWVQISHHGRNGATQEFYDAVGATGCLWPAAGSPTWTDSPATATKAMVASLCGDPDNASSQNFVMSRDGLVGIDIPQP